MMIPTFMRVGQNPFRIPIIPEIFGINLMGRIITSGEKEHDGNK
jgi:hypothetical protein